MPDPRVDELASFRRELYATFTKRRDALFELGDTLVATSTTSTLPPPHQSLEAIFRRGWGSAYGALFQGRIDEEHLRDLLVRHRPAHWPTVFAVDTSSWPRDDAECSPERGFYHHPSRHSAGKPIVAGWNYSFIAQVNFEKSSWSAPVDVQRVAPHQDTATVTASQVRDVVGRLGRTTDVPLFVFDAGYDPIALSVDLADDRCEVLCRIRSDRVFYTDPPSRQEATVGRPRRHGAELRLAEEKNLPEPDATVIGLDPVYGRIEVSAWHALHPKLHGRGRWAGLEAPPIVRGTVIRVEVEHLPKPTGHGRVKKTLWLWWSGPGEPDLERCWRAYLHRFDLEHTLRFLKGTLGWTTPRVRHPEQADRWSLLVVSAFNELRLARGLVADQRLPWEPPRSPDRLTPTRVRRGFRQLLPILGTPARPPKPTKAGPGRPRGSYRGPAQRYPPVKKSA
jgi:hypothetical protein